MPVTTLNRTVTQVAVSAAAGTPQDLVAIPGAGMRIFVVTIVVTISAGGTIKFTEGTGPTDLTGALDVAANGGFVCIGELGAPVLQTNTANAKLSIAATTGNAHGWIRYFVAPE